MKIPKNNPPKLVAKPAMTKFHRYSGADAGCAMSVNGLGFPLMRAKSVTQKPAASPPAKMAPVSFQVSRSLANRVTVDKVGFW